MSPRKYLSDAEFQVLKQKIDSSTSVESLVFGILLETGCRAGEVLRLEGEDIDKDRMAVFIRGLKGSCDRTLPLSKELFERLILVAPKIGRVFRFSYSMLYHRWKVFRTCPKKIHALRHTKAIRCYEESLDILETQQLLGHKDLKSTLIYQTKVYSVDQFRRYLK